MTSTECGLRVSIKRESSELRTYFHPQQRHQCQPQTGRLACDLVDALVRLESDEPVQSLLASSGLVAVVAAGAFFVRILDEAVYEVTCQRSHRWNIDCRGKKSGKAGKEVEEWRTFGRVVGGSEADAGSGGALIDEQTAAASLVVELVQGS
jgi:hypothetical protein